MRTHRVKSACVLGMLLLCGVVRAEQPWVGAVGKETLVCVSPQADAQVRQAADRVLAEVQKLQPGAVLVDPDALVTDYARLGTHHVICVGQWADNQVLRMTWGHWANSRQEREWNAKGDQRAIEQADLWKKEIPAQDWRWQHDLFAFGYGDFDGADVGYVQTVRNPFPILLRTVPDQRVYDTSIPRPYDRAPQNQMYFITELTGTGPAGVVKAVDVFLKDGLLNGVVPGAGKPLHDDWSLLGLGPKQLASDLPTWAPVSNLPAGVQYLGQQMPGSHLYGGFFEASGVQPQRMWRLKYGLADGFRFFDSFPTNRASGNELLIAACGSEADAKRAAEALRKTLPEEKRQLTWEFGGHSYAVYGDDLGDAFTQEMTWQEAKRFCEKQGGHLITLNSKGEQDALAKMLGAKKSQTTKVFIGLSGDWHTNRWAWVTGEPLTFRGWRIRDGKEVYGKESKKGHEPLDKNMPAGSNEPVWFTTFPEVGWYVGAGWYVEDKAIGAFVCEWDKPGAAPKPTVGARVATRGQYVLMQSFDEPAGEVIVRQGLENK